MNKKRSIRTEYLLRLTTFIILFVLISYPLGVPMHETEHVLVAESLGCEIQSYNIWSLSDPHVNTTCQSPHRIAKKNAISLAPLLFSYFFLSLLYISDKKLMWLKRLRLLPNKAWGDIFWLSMFLIFAIASMSDMANILLRSFRINWTIGRTIYALLIFLIFCWIVWKRKLLHKWLDSISRQTF